MGRPRKEPRQVVTFNIPVGVAEKIDDLRLSNRSEWMKGVLKDYFKTREMSREKNQIETSLIADPAREIKRIADAQIFDEAESRGIVAERFSTKRRIILALQAVREEMPTKKRLISDLEKALRDA